jgi:preprotein translocase subunit SecE
MLQVRVLPGLDGMQTRREGRIMKKIVLFFRESIAELKKVVWPGTDEVIGSTRVVIVSVLVIALALWLVDFVIYQGIDLVF